MMSDTNTPTAVEQFQSLIDKSEGYDRTKTDFRIRARDLSVNNDGKLVIVAPELPYDDATYQKQRVTFDSKEKAERVVGFTDASRIQMYAKLGSAHYGKGSNKALPGEYLEKFPPHMRADILNWTMERAEGTWKVRTDGEDCRAIVSGEYPRIWNTEVLRQLSRVLNDKNGLDGLHIERPYITPDEFAVRLWWDGAGTGNYRVGAQFGNNEVGGGSFVGRAMIQRRSCTNSIIVSNISAITGQKAGFEMIHYVGASAEAMMTQFYAQLPALMNASATLINRMIEAESIVLPDFSQIIAGLRAENGWDAPFTDLVHQGTEGQRTVAGVVNGITYAAHMDRNLSDTKSLELEVMGGSFLTVKPTEFVRLAAVGTKAQKSLHRI